MAYSAAEYSTTVQQGATDVTNHITAQASACPNQKFALAGYSKGAMVMHGQYLCIHSRAICSIEFFSPVATLSAAVQKKVIAGAVFGDPYRSTGDALPVNSQSSVVSYCNTGDPFCAGGSNVNAHLAYGTDGSATKGAQFIATKYKASA